MWTPTIYFFFKLKIKFLVNSLLTRQTLQVTSSCSVYARETAIFLCGLSHCLMICTFPSQRLDFLLQSAGKEEVYRKAERETKGKMMSQLVLDCLTKAEQKQGVASPIYKKEQDYYDKAVGLAFYNIMVSIFVFTHILDLMHIVYVGVVNQN